MKYLKKFKDYIEYQTFIKSDNYIEPNILLIDDNYNIIIKNKSYCTIEALEDDLTVSLSSNPLYYSVDNCRTWTELPAGSTTPPINAGEKISFKQTGLTPSTTKV